MPGPHHARPPPRPPPPPPPPPSPPPPPPSHPLPLPRIPPPPHPPHATPPPSHPPHARPLPCQAPAMPDVGDGLQAVPSYKTILFNGYSTMPCACAPFNFGIRSRTVRSSMIVLTATQCSS